MVSEKQQYPGKVNMLLAGARGCSIDPQGRRNELNWGLNNHRQLTLNMDGR
jgi:hypothetical protein